MTNGVPIQDQPLLKADRDGLVVSLLFVFYLVIYVITTIASASIYEKNTAQILLN